MRPLLLLPLLFFPLTLSAAEYTPNRDVNLIHNVVIEIGGNCCPMIYLYTKVGHLENGTCNFEKETQPRSYSFCGPERNFPLDGEQLEQMVGSGYECAATVAQDPSGLNTGFDVYQLKSVDNKYVASSPETGWIELKMQCAPDQTASFFKS